MINKEEINDRVDVLIDAKNRGVDWVDHCRKWRDAYKRNISNMDANDIKEMCVFLRAKLDLLSGDSC